MSMIGGRRIGNELQVDWLCACIRNLQSDSEHHRVVVITVKGAPSSPIAQPPTILPPACSFGADAHARQGVPALRCRNIGLLGLFSTMLDNQHQQDAAFSTSRSVKLFSVFPMDHQSAEYLLIQYSTASKRHDSTPQGLHFAILRLLQKRRCHWEGLTTVILMLEHPTNLTFNLWQARQDHYTPQQSR